LKNYQHILIGATAKRQQPSADTMLQLWIPCQAWDDINGDLLFFITPRFSTPLTSVCVCNKESFDLETGDGFYGIAETRRQECQDAFIRFLKHHAFGANADESLQLKQYGPILGLTTKQPIVGSTSV
jgi:hypothetical protein